MRILILSDDFPPTSFGGAGKIAFNLAKGFKDAGHQVLIVTCVQVKEQVGETEYQGLKIFRIYSDYHERWRAYRSLNNSQTISQLKEVIQKFKPDIVHCHNIHYYLSYHCLKVAKQSGARVFLTAHDAMLFHYGKLTEFINQKELLIPKKFDYHVSIWQQIKLAQKRYNPFRNCRIRYYLKYVDKIFAVSYALKEVLNQNGIKNVEVIHNGIDVNEWLVSEEKIKSFKSKFNLFNKKVVFYGGRLSELKGGGIILKTMKAVSQQIPGTALLIAGKTDNYTQEMLKSAEAQGINLILTNWLDGEDLKAAYHSSQLVVIPSIYLDPFPTVNLEAMACQRPIIGTCFGGTLEIAADGQTGYIVNPLNIKMMAEKILNLLNNLQKAQEFGQAGYQRVKNEFSLIIQVNKYLGYFYD